MKQKTRMLLAVLLLLALLLASCGKGSAPRDEKAEEISPSISYSKSSDEALYDSIYDGTPVKDEEKQKSAEENGQKLIRTFDLTAETKTYEQAVSDIQKKVKELGGYVASSRLSGGESYRSGRRGERQASLSLCIPSGKVDSFLSGLGEEVNVTSSMENATDVTETYYDMKARMETLIAKREALTAMLEKAENLSDFMTVNNALYEVIAEIEAYQTRLDRIDSQVEYSQVELTLYEVVDYTETEKLTFWGRIGRAFTDSWKDFFEGCKDFAVWFVEAFPTLLVIGAVLALLILIPVRIIRKKRKK